KNIIKMDTQQNTNDHSVPFVNDMDAMIKKIINMRLSDNSFELSNKILETLKAIVARVCRSCIKGAEVFSVPIGKIDVLLAGLEGEGEEQKKHIILRINEELFKIESILNKEILCEDCRKRKKI